MLSRNTEYNSMVYTLYRLGQGHLQLLPLTAALFYQPAGVSGSGRLIKALDNILSWLQSIAHIRLSMSGPLLSSPSLSSPVMSTPAKSSVNVQSCKFQSTRCVVFLVTTWGRAVPIGAITTASTSSASVSGLWERISRESSVSWWAQSKVRTLSAKCTSNSNRSCSGCYVNRRLHWMLPAQSATSSAVFSLIQPPTLLLLRFSLKELFSRLI